MAVFTGFLFPLGQSKSLVTYAQSRRSFPASKSVVTPAAFPVPRPPPMPARPFLIYYGWFAQNSPVLAQQARAMGHYSVVVIGSGTSRASRFFGCPHSDQRRFRHGLLRISVDWQDVGIAELQPCSYDTAGQRVGRIRSEGDFTG